MHIKPGSHFFRTVARNSMCIMSLSELFLAWGFGPKDHRGIVGEWVCVCLSTREESTQTPSQLDVFGEPEFREVFFVCAVIYHPNS